LELNRKTVRTVFLGVAGCILLYWVLHETGRVSAMFGAIMSVLMPFFAGAIVAFILNVPMRAIEKGLKNIKKPHLRRVLSIALTIIAVALVLAGVVWLLVPQLVKTIESLIDVLPGFFQRLQDKATEFLSDNPEVMNWLSEYTDFESFDWSALVQKAVSWISDGLTVIMNKALSAVVGLATGIFNAIISLVFAIYCLSRKEILARQGRRLIYAFLPEKFCDEIVRILRMANTTFSNFISGQCLEAVILGSIFAVAMAIFGMPFIPLVSVIIAVTALVPIVGAFIGCVVGAFFILVQDPLLAVWFVAMFLILQQMENNLIYPRVVGTSIGLPGMWVLVAVAIGGDMMGVAGMLLMIPLSSVLYALAREITTKPLKARGIPREKLQDHPPVLKSKFKEKREKRKEQKLLKKMQKLIESIHVEDEKHEQK